MDFSLLFLCVLMCVFLNEDFECLSFCFPFDLTEIEKDMR